MKFKIQFPLFVFFILVANFAKTQTRFSVLSPNKQIEVQVFQKNNQFFKSVNRNGINVLLNSTLGILREDGDFSNNLTMVSATA